MARSRLAVGVLCVVLAAASGAPAQVAPERSIALVSPGAELERAARTALEPWNVEIRVVQADPPGATAPRNSAAAREVALRHGVAAVVWLSEHELGHAIWVYDLGTDQLVARPLPFGLPFDGPTAAAVALSVKTLLRHSATAPAPERYGAAPSTTPPPPDPTADRSAEAPTARATGPIADHGETDGDEAVAPPPPSELDLEALASLRFGLTRPSATETRFGLGALLFPDAGAFGVGLRAAFGPGVHAAAAGFDGRLLDLAPALVGRVRLPLSRVFTLAASAGATAHVTLLDGTLAAAGTGEPEPIDSVVRLVPALDLELLGEVRVLPFLKLGLRAAAAYWLRPQRYQVGQQTAFELSRIAFEAGLIATAGLPNS